MFTLTHILLPYLNNKKDKAQTTWEENGPNSQIEVCFALYYGDIFQIKELKEKTLAKVDQVVQSSDEE